MSHALAHISLLSPHTHLTIRPVVLALAVALSQPAHSSGTSAAQLQLSSTARAVSIAELSGLINVRAFGAKQDGKTDDSTALAMAINAANDDWRLGHANCIYIPPGILLVGSKKSIPSFDPGHPACVLGAGSGQSILKMASEFSGDLLSWSGNWIVTHRGASVRGITVEGTSGALNIQNAITVYDQNDFFFVDDVTVSHVHGSCLSVGLTKHSKDAFLRESRVSNFRCWNSGTKSTPAMNLSSAGSGDSTNEDRFTNLDVYAPEGVGVAVTSLGSTPVRDLSFMSLRVEGSETGLHSGDLLTVGSASARSPVFGITFENLELIDPYEGSFALKIDGNKNAVPYFIRASGFIGGGAPQGGGLEIKWGRNMEFHFVQINTKGRDILLGPDAQDTILVETGEPPSKRVRDGK